MSFDTHYGETHGETIMIGLRGLEILCKTQNVHRFTINLMLKDSAVIVLTLKMLAEVL